MVRRPLEKPKREEEKNGSSTQTAGDEKGRKPEKRIRFSVLGWRMRIPSPLFIDGISGSRPASFSPRPSNGNLRRGNVELKLARMENVWDLVSTGISKQNKKKKRFFHFLSPKKYFFYGPSPVRSDGGVARYKYIFLARLTPFTKLGTPRVPQGHTLGGDLPHI